MKPEITAETIRQALQQLSLQPLSEPGLTPAAVLVPLFSKDGQWQVLFIRRSENLPTHAGQIAFPGGMRDPEDPDLLATALRESREEMGIAPEQVTVLGRLDDVPTVTGYCISSFVGVIPYPYPFRPNRAEIAEVIELPLACLLDPAGFRRDSSWQWRGQPHQVYFFQCGERLVWGATAKIVKQFLEVAAGWEEPSASPA
jgi:8-oxo-dGTP pyrophosphatase MutT (NUDIX family)